MKKKNRVFLLVLISFFLFAGCEMENEVVAEKPEITAKKSKAVAEKPRIAVERLWTKQEIIDMEKRLNSMGGLFSRGTALQVRPPFYQGQMPLNYVSIVQQRGSGGMMSSISLIILSHNFGTWRNIFFYDEMAIRRMGMPNGAIAIDNNNTLIAECKVTKMITKEDQLIGFELQENHYDLQGRATFSSIFEVDFFDGVKTKEIKTQGTKEKEYFFIWPTGLLG